MCLLFYRAAVVVVVVVVVVVDALVVAAAGVFLHVICAGNQCGIAKASNAAIEINNIVK